MRTREEVVIDSNSSSKKLLALAVAGERNCCISDTAPFPAFQSRPSQCGGSQTHQRLPSQARRRGRGGASGTFSGEKGRIEKTEGDREALANDFFK